MNMKKENIRNLIKKFDDIMTAASFAEEGEFETARKVVKEGKRVLLAVREGEVERKALTYALNTCKRIGADMDVLYLSSGNSDEGPILKQFFSELEKEGIGYRLIRGIGRLREEIRNYTDSEISVNFVVVESLAVDRWSKEEELSEILKKMKCPLVVVDTP
jgi:hypothetical protein